MSCIKTDLLRTMSTLLRTTLWHQCVLVDCTRCSEYFVQLFEAWTWLVCMLACLRLCVTSQLSRATLRGPALTYYFHKCQKLTINTKINRLRKFPGYFPGSILLFRYYSGTFLEGLANGRVWKLFRCLHLSWRPAASRTLRDACFIVSLWHWHGKSLKKENGQALLLCVIRCSQIPLHWCRAHTS